MIKRVAVPVFGLILAVSQTGVAQAERVGVTSAVNPAAAGTPPGATTRQLVVGEDVNFRERVITTDEGQAQILFLDQSTLMIGPNSSVVIDEFVYDPNTSKGNVAATLTQGSFRYIGGKLSKQGNATLKTPIATIGIRGSDVTVTFDPAKNQTGVVTTHGSANVQTLGGVLGLRTGFGTTINGGGAPPGQATSLTAAQIVAANKIFEGQPGKNAGAGKPPTDADVAKSGVSSAVEAKGLAAIEPAAGGQSGSAGFNVPFTPGNNDTPQTATVPTPPPATPPVSPTSPVSPTPPASRTAQTLNGYVAGFGLTQGEGTTTYMLTNTNRAPTDVEIRTTPDPDGVGRVLAKFNYRATHSQQPVSASIELGDPPGSNAATRSAFLNDLDFLALQVTGASSGKAQVNGANANVNALLVSVADPSTFQEFAGHNVNTPLCDCQFVKWGLWTATLQAGDNPREIVPIGLWVAGALPNVSDPSPQGIATFNGTALGFVQGKAAPVTGAFQNVYNFGMRRGDVTISNFDGNTFGGRVKAGETDWRSYSGHLSGSSLDGRINGSFYGNRTAAGQLQTPQETAGNFNVSKQGYAASGIFIGKR